MLLKPLVKRHRVLLSPEMNDVLFKGDLQYLLKFWGGKPEEIPPSISWLRENKQTINFKPTPLDKKLEEFRKQYVVVALRRHIIDNDPNLQFITDDVIQFISAEICLALGAYSNPIPTPIFCTQTSSWKIVEIFKKIGANMKNEIIEYAEHKKTFFRENWEIVLCKAARGAFVWVFEGVEHLGFELGFEGMQIAIEDP